MVSQDMPIDILVRPIGPDEALAIRAETLIPPSHQVLPFDNDQDPLAVHLGAFVGGHLVGAASFLPEAYPVEPECRARRLRGMAVLEGLRGIGVGGTLVSAAWPLLHAEGVAVCWAHARDGALGFYLRMGWAVVGDGFIGAYGIPHHLIEYRLSRCAPAGAPDGAG